MSSIERLYIKPGATSYQIQIPGFLFSIFLYGEENIKYDIENLLKDSFSFQLQENFKYKDKIYSLYRGSINYNDGNWYGLFAGSYEWIEIKNVEKNNSSIYLTIQHSSFTEKGKTKKYWNWNYPRLYKIEITKEILEEILSCKKNNSVYYYYLYDIESNNGFCHAIVITDNLRVRALPNIESEILTKLKKFEDIMLIDCSIEKEEIDGITAHWYKIKLDNDIEGWIFGGYAKIYFSVKNDKEDIIKAFEKEGSEYIN